MFSPLAEFPQFLLLEQTPHLIYLMTIIRDKDTNRSDFIFYSDRIFRILMEAALSQLPFEEKKITTPTSAPYTGKMLPHELCGVSIIRAGESMEKAIRQIIPNISVGKILIQRKEDGSGDNVHYYTKLPINIRD
ncbi:MAG: uracil phosphoribosyltransferase, partial [Streblomastix strix]